jgi:hypothetical protein
VEADNRGDHFLDTVATTFLRMGGGEVLAWTSPGYVSSGLPFVGDHTIHWTGDLKRFVYTAMGGRAIRVA